MLRMRLTRTGAKKRPSYRVIVTESEFPREGSQCLGQKNTTFTIYLALAYTSPVVALGPTFYVLWHNLWNSWQLHRAARTGRAASS